MTQCEVKMGPIGGLIVKELDCSFSEHIDMLKLS